MKGLERVKFFFLSVRSLSSDSSYLAEQRLRQAYSCLDLDESAEASEVRDRYTQLIRRYHPDTGGENADSSRLHRICDAYRLIVKSLEGEIFEEDEKDFGIQHVVPQHRQYLEYGGVGHGNPSTRLRQFQQYRAMNALENVREFTVEKTIRNSRDPKNVDLIAVNQQKKRRKHQLTGMLDRVVEDMILSSMATGEFSNLKGAGKPLEVDHSNPYLDQTQQKINRILRDSGFAPPWIVKENELKKKLAEYRQRLCNELALSIVSLVNSGPFNASNFLHEFDEAKASSLLTNKLFVENEINEINGLIQNYNLIAPSMDRQLMTLKKHLEVRRAKDAVLKDFPNSPFLVEAQKKFNQEETQKGKETSKRWSPLEDLLGKWS